MAKSAADTETAGGGTAVVPLELRDPFFAAVLAWLLPGAGHWYQGRRTKAILFFTCILGTFVYGLWLGGGRVVYASWGPTSEEKRLPYLCQLGAGAVALPALVQTQRYQNGPYVKAMTEKEDKAQQAVRVEGASYWNEMRKKAAAGGRSFREWFMAPPVLKLNIPGRGGDELDYLNYRLHRNFELGTVYTMIAGLLNILVVFDAFAGPAYGVRRSTAADKPVESKEDIQSETAPAS